MIERHTSTDQVIAGALWVAVCLLYVVAAVLLLHGAMAVGIFVANVACGTSAYAAVRHLRGYAVHICRKIDETALERDVARLTGVPGQRVRQ